MVRGQLQKESGLVYEREEARRGWWRGCWVLVRSLLLDKVYNVEGQKGGSLPTIWRAAFPRARNERLACQKFSQQSMRKWELRWGPSRATSTIHIFRKVSTSYRFYNFLKYHAGGGHCTNTQACEDHLTLHPHQLWLCGRHKGPIYSVEFKVNLLYDEKL